MQIASILVPLFTLLASVAGFYLRQTELAEVFDASTGLPERGAGLTIVLIALSAAVLLVGLIFSIRTGKKYMSPRGFDSAFGTNSIAYPLSFSLIGLIWIGATVKHFLDLDTSAGIPMGELYFSILSALSAISIALFAIEIYQDPRRKITYALSIVPALFMCYWLIVLYKQNAANPILLSFCYQCLAIISAALSFYFTSGFVFSKPAPGKTILTYITTVYFGAVTLADNHIWTLKLIFIAIVAANFTYLPMLIKNLKTKTDELNAT